MVFCQWKATFLNLVCPNSCWGCD